MTKRPQKQQSMSTGARTALIVGGVVAVALIALIIATFSTGDGGDDASQFAPVSFSGEPGVSGVISPASYR